MEYKRILTIQDISCVGQCSLTVALPILSACGLETAILPSAVLSTHTAGFKGYTFRDLTDDMPKIREHWNKEGIKFAAVYTGYLGSTKQVDYVLDIAADTLEPGGLCFVDPAMADNGSLYPGFDQTYVDAMKRLCTKADYILPNITEACFLTDTEYQRTPGAGDQPDVQKYDKAYIDTLLDKLQQLGCKNIILTGVSYAEGKTGIEVMENGRRSFYEHEFLPNSCHGTGDIYASAFVGAMMGNNGPHASRAVPMFNKTAYESAKIAADYTVECIRQTAQEENHWYGAKFEPALPKLITLLHG